MVGLLSSNAWKGNVMFEDVADNIFQHIIGNKMLKQLAVPRNGHDCVRNSLIDCKDNYTPKHIRNGLSHSIILSLSLSLLASSLCGSRKRLYIYLQTELENIYTEP
jgi:hypothetical protein